MSLLLVRDLVSPSVDEACHRVERATTADHREHPGRSLADVAYRHRQTSWLVLVLVAAAVVVVLVLVALAEDDPTGVWFAVGVTALLVSVASVFARLEVLVDDRSVVAAFGWGWPRRRVALSDIESVAPRRNRWYHGWGIRKVAGGWMFNVAGYDSVELCLRSGRVFRIGSDEPHVLTAAIESARRATSAR